MSDAPRPRNRKALLEKITPSGALPPRPPGERPWITRPGAARPPAPPQLPQRVTRPKGAAKTENPLPPVLPAGAITPREYGGLQHAYEHFNTSLFDGELPNVLITYQRKARSRGYFSPDRFAARGAASDSPEHELALNPDGFAGQTDQQICQTLAHEMCHVWRQCCDTPSRIGYHDRLWAAKMKWVGLQPTSTGRWAAGNPGSGCPI